ncbi:MAG: hypothetical protein QM706_12680 [Nitrospira sp.]
MTVRVEDCVTEREVKIAVSNRTLGDVIVTETSMGFYVKLEFQYIRPRWFWLTSKRSPSVPRCFKHLGRLNDHLRILAPSATVRIQRERVGEGRVANSA